MLCIQYADAIYIYPACGCYTTSESMRCNGYRIAVWWVYIRGTGFMFYGIRGYGCGGMLCHS